MTWLIIVLALMLVISPLVSSLPNKRQRTIGALRQRALIRGFRVERIDEAGRVMAGYRWTRERPARDPAFSRDLDRTTDPELFADLPAGVERIELRQGSMRVVWDEEGSEADIERLGTLMQELYRVYP